MLTTAEHTLEVDPIRCEGNGACVELLPEGISLDDWGFPMVPSEPLPSSLLGHARRAVSSCPVRALQLRRREPVPTSRSHKKGG